MHWLRKMGFYRGNDGAMKGDGNAGKGKLMNADDISLLKQLF